MFHPTTQGATGIERDVGQVLGRLYMQGVNVVLRYLILVTPILWAVVFYLIWQRKKHGHGLRGTRANRNPSRSSLKATASTSHKRSRPAPVITLFPTSTSPRKARPKEDHSE
ncbi:MAG: hypothetical protein C7B43_03025 [Sulfobacillus benefaciens]|uniref:Uncharacterized protein n=1 Tax=Sulfobacillus benefaciens TaxID=453960 RepID=A0A2T2X9G0_9FIRM|nr:MAG: hypothetical protein C7B43_03025 [Sulfobacillus benefaciens]